MLLTLRQQLSRFSHILQRELFPVLESELGELSGTGRLLVAVLELIPLARFIPSSQGWNGRPPRGRNAIHAHSWPKQSTIFLAPAICWNASAATNNCV
jgi:hypothetical protein